MTHKDRLLQLHYAVARHVLATGPRHWELVRAEFADIEDTEFWREVAWVQARHDQGLVAWPQEACTARAAALEGMFNPAPPPVRHDWSEQLQAHLADIDRLRAACLDEQGRVRDRRGFAAMLKLSEQALRLRHQLQADAMTNDLVRRWLQEFAVVVSTFAPPLRKQIIERLEELNYAFGIYNPAEE